MKIRNIGREIRTKNLVDFDYSTYIYFFSYLKQEQQYFHHFISLEKNKIN